MKNFIILFVLAYSTISFAQNLNNNEAPEFIVKMADARRMDREEGRLAAGLASTKAIRDYGSLMVKDQETLLAKLQQLATSKNITLPNAISEKKNAQLTKLSALREKAFDRKFLKMMKTDHKRDVKKFKKAMKFEDEATKKFAKENLPMIQQHLDGVKAL
ncbi:DUF4142 domain-containing protein [Flavobacterium sp.]|uniref:DUF4142 domain-containing protein n=1 Tax=Flavobacterium sp. TaxID=239 RepID=UPI00286D5E38|nr:DUF4142 domain-containing protein [Flavobacterium sp.]